MNGAMTMGVGHGGFQHRSRRVGVRELVNAIHLVIPDVGTASLMSHGSCDFQLIASLAIRVPQNTHHSSSTNQVVQHTKDRCSHITP